MSQDQTNPWSPQDALVAMMVAVSVADQDIKTIELLSIERIVNHLPIFFDYDPAKLSNVSNAVFDILTEEDGLEALFGLVKTALPESLYETSYALCCDVAAADLIPDQQLQLHSGDIYIESQQIREVHCWLDAPHLPRRNC